MTTHPTPFDMHSPHTPPAPLSAAGRARRDAMLAELQDAVVDAARRRRTIRAAVVIAPPALALAAALALLAPAPGWSWGGRSGGGHGGRSIAGSTPTNAPTPPPPVAPAAPTRAGQDPAPTYTMQHADFQLVTTPPSAQIVTGPPTNVQTISDDELIEILRATGHDVGLIRTGQRVILTDNRPAQDRPGPSSRLDSGHPAAAGDPAV